MQTDDSSFAGQALDAKLQTFERITQGRLERACRLAAALLRDRAEAEDAVSDAAMLAWTHWGQLRDLGRFDAWFDRILINECRKRLRRRRPSVIAELRGHQDGGDIAGSVAQRDALRCALESLSVDHRVVLVLRFVEDLPLKEISLRTGQREGTVKSRLHYALRYLREAYGRDEQREENESR